MVQITMEDLFDEAFLGREISEPDGTVTYMECKHCGSLVRYSMYEYGVHPMQRHLMWHQLIQEGLS